MKRGSSVPKFDITKLEARKVEEEVVIHSPHHEEKEAMLRSKAAWRRAAIRFFERFADRPRRRGRAERRRPQVRMTAIRRANDIRQNVKQQIIENLLETSGYERHDEGSYAS